MASEAMKPKQKSPYLRHRSSAQEPTDDGVSLKIEFFLQYTVKPPPQGYGVLPRCLRGFLVNSKELDSTVRALIGYAGKDITCYRASSAA
jgi:hypothetical protein